MTLRRIKILAAATLCAIAASAGSASAAELSWSGDGVSAPLSAQWAAISDQEHCAETTSTSNTPDKEIFSVTDNRFAKNPIEFLMNNGGGKGPCYSGRDELQQGNPYSSTKVDRRFYPGNEYWLAWQAVFAPSYFAAGSNGNGMVQIHRPCNGKSPFGIGGRANGELIVYWINQSGQFIETPIGPKLAPETLYSFVVHYVASSTQTGSWQVFESVAGGPQEEVLSEKAVATILPGTCGPLSAFATIGLYPGFVKAGLSERIGGYNVSTTREAAEASAFGPTIEPPPPTEDVAADEAAEQATAKALSAAEASLTAAKAAVKAAEVAITEARAATIAVAGA